MDYIDAEDLDAMARHANALSEHYRAKIERLRAALTELRSYAASVWFDEANASDEEREIMDRARIALTL
jgi:hypothetical protein